MGPFTVFALRQGMDTFVLHIAVEAEMFVGPVTFGADGTGVGSCFALSLFIAEALTFRALVCGASGQIYCCFVGGVKYFHAFLHQGVLSFCL